MKTKVQVNYTCRFGFRHSSEIVPISKVLTCMKCLSYAGCVVTSVQVIG